MKVLIVNKGTCALPAYQSDGSAGMDVRANIDEPLMLNPLERALVPTGLFLEMPQDIECQVRPRSGLALKNGLTVLNSPGTIDSDYRGEIGVILVNLSNDPVEIKPDDRIAQLVFCNVLKVDLHQVETLHESQRGSAGFGSTGIN